MTILCLDVGDRRIGLALSDPSNLFAVPLGAIRRTRRDSDIDAVILHATERNADRLVVGVPLSLNGREGPQARKVNGFIQALGRKTSLPIHRVDERFSTAEAERRLRQAGVEPSREREKVDAAAAAVILQDYLNTLTVGTNAEQGSQQPQSML